MADPQLIRRAAEEVVVIASARIGKLGAPNSVEDVSDEIILERLRNERSPTQRERLSLELSLRFAKAAQATASEQQLQNATFRLAGAFYSATQNKTYSERIKQPLANMALDLLEVMGSTPPLGWQDNVQRTLSACGGAGADSDWHSALGLREEDLLLQTALLRSALVDDPPPEPPPERRQRSGDSDGVEPKDPRLAALSFEGFRGSPYASHLKMSDKRGKPMSVLIYGENGTGKSTAIDALEFACQRRVGRTNSIESDLRPSVLSYARTGMARVSVEFISGETLSRAVRIGGSGRLVVDNEHVPTAFRIAPISLQRSDVLRFLDTSASDRGKLLFGYFQVDSDLTTILPPPTVDQELLEEEVVSLKAARRTVTAELQQRLGLPVGRTSSQDLMAAIAKVVPPSPTRRRGEPSPPRPKLTTEQRHLLDRRATYERLSGRLSEVQRALRDLHTTSHGLFSDRVQAFGVVFADVGKELTRTFKNLAQADYVDRIDVTFGSSTSVAVDIEVVLTNGRRCSPNQVFSEGYRDLLSLLFFLAVAKEAHQRGQAPILLLDDVVQSVDGGIRLDLMRYLLDEFSGWQLVLTAHDRLWREQLTELFRARGVRFVDCEIRSWDFDSGPDMLVSTVALDSSLRSALDHGDTATIALSSGRLLELIANQLSWSLPVSVVRRRGDRYTLGDLWPGVLKQLRKLRIKVLVERINDYVHIRNLIGAHYNDWATGIPSIEVRSFAGDVLELLTHVYCDACGQWLAPANGGGFSCRCGAVRLDP